MLANVKQKAGKGRAALCIMCAGFVQDEGAVYKCHCPRRLGRSSEALTDDLESLLLLFEWGSNESGLPDLLYQRDC
jgi:hypothetical protein